MTRSNLTLGGRLINIWILLTFITLLLLNFFFPPYWLEGRKKNDSSLYSTDEQRQKLAFVVNKKILYHFFWRDLWPFDFYFLGRDKTLHTLYVSSEMASSQILETINLLWYKACIAPLFTSLLTELILVNWLRTVERSIRILPISFTIAVQPILAISVSINYVKKDAIQVQAEMHKIFHFVWM